MVEIVVDLEFIEDAASANSSLSFSFHSEASSATDKTSGAIYVVNADVGAVLAKSDPSGNSATLLRQHLPQCLIANVAPSPLR